MPPKATFAKRFEKLRDDLVAANLPEDIFRQFDLFAKTATDFVDASSESRINICKAYKNLIDGTKSEMEFFIQLQSAGKTIADLENKLKECESRIEDGFSSADEVPAFNEKEEYKQRISNLELIVEQRNHTINEHDTDYAILKEKSDGYVDVITKQTSALMEKDAELFKLRAENDVLKSNAGSGGVIPPLFTMHASTRNEASFGWNNIRKLREPKYLEEWIYKIDCLKAASNISDVQMVNNAIMYLECELFSFAKNLRIRKPNSDWAEFKSELLQRFSAASEYQKRKALMERRQNRNETLLSYIEAKLELCLKLNSQMPDSEKLQTIKDGFSDEYRKMFMIPGITSIDSLIEKAKEVSASYASVTERTAKIFRVNNVNVPAFKKKEKPQWQQTKGNTSTFTHSQKYTQSKPNSPKSDKSSSRSSSPASSEGNRKKNLRCYACNGLGHIARYCRRRQSSHFRSGYRDDSARLWDAINAIKKGFEEMKNVQTSSDPKN